MKKTAIIMAMIMVLTMVGCKKESKIETKNERIIRIMESYTRSWDTEYNGEPTTTFRFATRNDAKNFADYWLDYGISVGCIWEVEGNYYTVEIMEEDFENVCEELVRALE